jgi:glycosyltransferase involved in cell wall biosynthesis
VINLHKEKSSLKIALNAWFWDKPDVGSGQYLKYLVPALLKADESLEIILISPKPFTGEASHPRLQYYHSPTPFSNQAGNPAKVWFEQITFPRVCRALSVELGHVPYFGSPLMKPVPIVVTIHDMIPMVLREYRGNWQVRLYTSLVAAAALQADMILADSHASRNDILARLKLPAEKVSVVYLAPAPHFQPAEAWQQIVEIKKKYKLPEDFVLYLGGYDLRKNVEALLHAYTWVSGTLHDEYPLVLAGKLPARETALFPDPIRIARELGIEEFINIPGWIEEEDKPLLYAAATVFVYPSRYEGFGLPVLEAMACGTPVITTDAASIPELAGAAAFQINPDDTRHLAAPIIRLCTEEDSRDDLIQRGFDQVVKFSWQKTANETIQTYRDVLKKP